MRVFHYKLNEVRKCIVCGREFVAHRDNAHCCSAQCHNDKQTLDRSEYLKAHGVENVDYVIDRWSGIAVTRLYGPYFRKHYPGRTIEEYRKEFPDALICTPADRKSTTENTGKFMKTEKYKKMYSEKFKGENNPMHRSKRTEQQRKETSPFSIEFYKKRGLTEQDMKDFIATVEHTDRTKMPNCIEYYTSRGISEEEAHRIIREAHAFTLEKCIQKYGEEKGTEFFKDRQRRWLESMKKSKGASGSVLVSIVSTKFISEVMEGIDTTLMDLKYGMNEHTIVGDSKVYVYDFTNLTNKRIIEFNGDYWHGNPRKYKGEQMNKTLGKSFADIWERDRLKVETAERMGFKVMVVWEYDYMYYKDETVKKAREFMFGN